MPVYSKIGRASESGRVRWKIPNSRWKRFPHIKSFYRKCQSAISRCVQRKKFNCYITKNGSVPASWKLICEKNRELSTDKDFNLADLWRKSEQESGVKFDIQKDATNKQIQQPKYDALKNCDTEHVTDNLVTTVAQKSNSYLEAAKGNLYDTNNNKTIPIRYILEQGIAVNEGVPTSESPNVMEVVLTA